MKIIISFPQIILSILILSSFSHSREAKDGRLMKTPSPGNHKAEIRNSDKAEQEKRDGRIDKLKKALEYQKSIVMPILNQFLEHPVKCERLEDNEEALKEYRNLVNRESCPDLREHLDIGRKTPISMVNNPEMERKIQELTEGRVCFSYPNSTTISGIVDIWEKHPCSEATVMALMRIQYLLNNPNISNKDVSSRWAYFEEILQIYDYVIANYPDNSWQVEYAHYAKTFYSYDGYSVEFMTAQENWIQCIEWNKLFENKYMLKYGHSKEILITDKYGRLLEIYNERCKLITKDNIDKNKGVPRQALDMYEKHYNLLVRLQKLYPSESTRRFVKWRSKDECHELVKKHAPKHYKGGPIILDEAENK